MERGDLLSVNGGIFKPQGQAINDHAAERRARPRRRQPVQHQLPDRPVERARRPRRPLVRDDPPRREPGQDAARQEGRRAGRARSPTWRSGATTRPPSSPTSRNARIGGKPAPEVIDRHRAGCRATFIETVQKRGAAVIEERGAVVGGVGRERGDRLGEQRRTSPRPATTSTRWRSCSSRRVRRARGPAVRLPGAQRRLVVDGRRGHRARRLRRRGRSRSRPRSSLDERDEVRTLGLVPG